MKLRFIKSIRETCRLVALPCRQATQLISHSMDQPLPWPQRFALKSHLWICRLCRRYHQQLSQIRDAMGEWEARDTELSTPGLSRDARQRIKANLQREAQNNEGI